MKEIILNSEKINFNISAKKARGNKIDLNVKIAM